MARTTYVKRAQQRYETVTVLNEDGTPKRVPVMGRDGQQKVTKRGPQFMTVTRDDKTKPLPNRHCDKCSAEIKVGDPYKWIKPKSGPYGGSLMVRCGTCPSWEVWEYSSSLSARIAQIRNDFDVSECETVEDVSSALEAMASAVREVAEEKREAASNIEEGFGHETSTSQDLNDTADNLDAWADEIEQADVPDVPEPEEDDCTECEGTGQIEDPAATPAVDEAGEEIAAPEIDCPTCNGTGQHTPDEPTDEQMDEWRNEVESAVAVVDESPV